MLGVGGGGSGSVLARLPAGYLLCARAGPCLAPSPRRGEGWGEGVLNLRVGACGCAFTSDAEPPHPTLSPLGRGPRRTWWGSLGLPMAGGACPHPPKAGALGPSLSLKGRGARRGGRVGLPSLCGAFVEARLSLRGRGWGWVLLGCRIGGFNPRPAPFFVMPDLIRHPSSSLPPRRERRRWTPDQVRGDAKRIGRVRAWVLSGAGAEG
jgi:hypothetical protein